MIYLNNHKNKKIGKEKDTNAGDKEKKSKAVLCKKEANLLSKYASNANNIAIEYDKKPSIFDSTIFQEVIIVENGITLDDRDIKIIQETENNEINNIAEEEQEEPSNIIVIKKTKKKKSKNALEKQLEKIFKNKDRNAAAIEFFNLFYDSSKTKEQQLEIIKRVNSLIDKIDTSNNIAYRDLIIQVCIGLLEITNETAFGAFELVTHLADNPDREEEEAIKKNTSFFLQLLKAIPEECTYYKFFTKDYLKKEPKDYSIAEIILNVKFYIDALSLETINETDDLSAINFSISHLILFSGSTKFDTETVIQIGEFISSEFGKKHKIPLLPQLVFNVLYSGSGLDFVQFEKIKNLQVQDNMVLFASSLLTKLKKRQLIQSCGIIEGNLDPEKPFWQRDSGRCLTLFLNELLSGVFKQDIENFKKILREPLKEVDEVIKSIDCKIPLIETIIDITQLCGKVNACCSGNKVTSLNDDQVKLIFGGNENEYARGIFLLKIVSSYKQDMIKKFKK